MPTPEFLQHHSRFVENLLEHRFLFDLGRSLALRKEPELLGILKAQVDMNGVDLTLTSKRQIRHLQMKTRSNRPAATPYEISDAIWGSEDGCVVWMIYESATLEPTEYHLLGRPLPELRIFAASPKKAGFRKVWTRNANHRFLSIEDLAKVLFPE